VGDVEYMDPYQQEKKRWGKSGSTMGEAKNATWVEEYEKAPRHAGEFTKKDLSTIY